MEMVKKLLALAAVLGAAFFVVQKTRSRSNEDPWQEATS